jgi:hypothetical protein
MRASEIARTWDVSPSYVGRLVKRGLPLTSVAAADGWRLANLQKPPRSSSGAAIVSQAATPTAGTILDGDQSLPFARLKRAQRAEILAFDLLEQLAKGANAIAMRAGVHAWGEAKKRVSEAELEYAKHQQATGEVISSEEVREFISKFLGTIRSLMDALPSSVCFKANPSDPEHARLVLTEGTDAILKAVSSAESNLPPAPRL